MDTRKPEIYRPRGHRRMLAAILLGFALLAALGAATVAPSGGPYGRPSPDNNYGQPAGDPFNSRPDHLSVRSTIPVAAAAGAESHLTKNARA